MSKNLTRRDFLIATGLGVAGTTTTPNNEFPYFPTTDNKVCSPGNSFTTHDIAQAILNVLPEDQPYGHHHRIENEPIHRLLRDPEQIPNEQEFSLAEGNWQLYYPVGSGDLITTAANDFQAFLKQSMNVSITLKQVDSFQKLKSKEPLIILGTREHFPQYGNRIKGPKGYAVIREKRQLLVIGYDEPGALQGVFYLEALMKLREAPFLPQNLNQVRESLYDRRMVLSGLGWMDWPDNLLAHIAHDGFDGIFTSVYANPNGDRTTAESSTDFYARLMYTMRKQSPDRIKDLIQRAAKWGIKVYTPIIYQYLGTEDSEKGLRKLVQEITTEFPDMGGYVLLTEGFWYKKWGGLHGAPEAEVREWADNWGKAVGIVTEEVHRKNPSAHVLAWEYNIDFRPQNTRLKRYFVEKLPPDANPSLTWENGKGFELDGMQGYLRDYSLSQVGPAEVTQAQIEVANGRNMKVFSKVDTFASWQFGTIPYLPFPGQWRKRYDALAKYGVKGTIESWSSGYTPNFIVSLRYWTCWDNSIPFPELLEKTAARIFGQKNVSNALKAWEHFDNAIRLVPDTGPNMGTNNAIGNPLFFKEPPLRTATFHRSWTDHNAWTGYLGSYLNPYWPFTVKRMVFVPDFTNQTNRAEQYARSATGIVADPNTKLLPVFLKYLKGAAEEMEKGLKYYRKAALESPEWKKPIALREVMVAEQLQRMMESNAAILEFEDRRMRWVATENKQEGLRILDEMEEILKREIERTKLAQIAVSRDSRFGFQFEQDYVYTPFSLSEKMRSLRETLEVHLPAARKER